MQAQAVQKADDLASLKDVLQVEVEAVRQEMVNVKEQLTEQQVSCMLMRLNVHTCLYSTQSAYQEYPRAGD